MNVNNSNPSNNASSSLPYTFIDDIVKNMVDKAVTTAKQREADKEIIKIASGLYEHMEKGIVSQEEELGITEKMKLAEEAQKQKILKQAPEQLKSLGLPSCYDSMTFSKVIPLHLIRFFRILEDRTHVFVGARSFFMSLMSHIESSPCSLGNQRMMTEFLQRLDNPQWLENPQLVKNFSFIKQYLTTKFFAGEHLFSDKTVAQFRLPSSSEAIVASPAAPATPTPTLAQEAFSSIQTFSNNVLAILEDTFRNIFNSNTTKSKHELIRQARLKLRGSPLLTHIEKEIAEYESFLKKLTVISTIYFGRKKVLHDQIAQIAHHLQHPISCSPMVIRYLTNHLKTTISLLKKQADEAFNLIDDIKNVSSLNLTKVENEAIFKEVDIYSIAVSAASQLHHGNKLSSTMTRMGRLMVQTGKTHLTLAEQKLNAKSKEDSAKLDMMSEGLQNVMLMYSKLASTLCDLASTMKQATASLKGLADTREETRKSIQQNRQKLLQTRKITPLALREIEANCASVIKELTQYYCHLRTCKEGIEIWDKLLNTYQKYWLDVAAPSPEEIDLDILWPLLTDASSQEQRRADCKIQEERKFKIEEEVEEDEAPITSLAVGATAPTLHTGTVCQTYSLAFDGLSRMIVAPANRSAVHPLSLICLRDVNFHFRLFSGGLDLLKECIETNQNSVLRPLMRHFIRTSAAMTEQHLSFEHQMKGRADELHHSHRVLAESIQLYRSIPPEERVWVEEMIVDLDCGVVSVRYPNSTCMIFERRRETLPGTLNLLLHPEQAATSNLVNRAHSILKFMQMRAFSSDDRPEKVFAQVYSELQGALKSGYTRASEMSSSLTSISQGLQRSLRPSLESLEKMVRQTEFLVKSNSTVPLLSTACKEVHTNLIALHETLNGWISLPRTRYLPLFGDLLWMHAQVIDEQIQAAIYIKRTGGSLHRHDNENYRVLNEIVETPANALTVAALNIEGVGMNYPYKWKWLHPQTVFPAIEWRLKALDVALFGDMYDAGDIPGRRRIAETPAQLRETLVAMVNSVISMAKIHINNFGE